MLGKAEPAEVIDNEITTPGTNGETVVNHVDTYPEHVKGLTGGLTENLHENELNAAKKFVVNNADLFFKSEFDSGRTNIAQHNIDTGNNRPFKQTLRITSTSYCLPTSDRRTRRSNACK